MATISLIQGTDSLSSSRITLNDNFTAINDEVGTITALFDPTTANITGMNSIATTELNVGAGASAIFTAALNTLATVTNVTGILNINAGITYKSVAVGTGGMPVALAFAHSTYIVDATTATLPITLNQANEGQEITILASGGIVTVDVVNIAGVVTSTSIAQNGTLTLRWVNTKWYVVGSFLATIV
jgi:hypothetical protein